MPRSSQKSSNRYVNAQQATSLTTATQPKKSLCDRLTDRIVRQLEKGVVPWKKPWKILLDGHCEVPCNYLTKKAYRGANALSLACNSDERPYYLTYNQALALGGQVRKGEQGQLIIFYKFDKRENAEGHTTTSYYEQASYVFNIAQIEGIEWKLPDLKGPQPLSTTDVMPECEAIMAGYKNGPILNLTEIDRAFYRLTTDTVSVPRREAFSSVGEYYKVIFHELGHSTGHPDRLNRADVAQRTRADKPGTDVYSREELTAEMAAYFLANLCGITSGDDSAEFLNSVSYINAYLNMAKNDTGLFYTAVRQAQKTADYILGVSLEAISGNAAIAETADVA